MALICASALAVPMPFATPSRPGPSAAQLETRLASARAAHAATVFPDQAAFPGGAGFVVTPSGLSEAAGSAKTLTPNDGYVLVTPRKGGKGERAVDTGRVRYTYDKMGRRISMTAAALAGTVTYRYDAVGRLIGLTDHKGRLYGFAYDDADRRTRLTRPNGVTTEYAYDLGGQLAAIRHLRNGIAIEMAEYAYDGRGLPTNLTDTAGTRAFTYDDTGQLLSATDPVLGAETFAYDALGNHLGKGRTYDPANRLLDDADTTYDYDANGSLLAREPKAGGSGTGYEWDDSGRLTAVTLPGGERVSFAYRVDGPRTAVTTPAGTTRYVYDGEDIVATLDAAGNVLATFTHGPGIDEPLALHTAAGSYDYLADGLGSIQALADASGAIVERYRYTAFGQTSIADAAGAPLVASALGNPYGFTAREMGSLPGVPYYYRARYYEPELGRWVSEDPIGLGGGSNVFGYCANSPASVVDPFGLSGSPCSDRDVQIPYFLMTLAATADGFVTAATAGLFRPFGQYYDVGSFPELQWSIDLGSLSGTVASLAFAAPRYVGAGAGEVLVTHWGTKAALSERLATQAQTGVSALRQKDWVMIGGPSLRNWVMSGSPGKYLPWRYVTEKVPAATLRSTGEMLKDAMGQARLGL